MYASNFDILWAFDEVSSNPKLLIPAKDSIVEIRTENYWSEYMFLSSHI